MGTDQPKLRRRTRRSAIEQLDAEEARACEALKHSLVSAGEDLSAKADLRATVQRHPLAALGIGAALGALLGPLAVNLVRAGMPSVTRHKGRSASSLERWIRRLPGVL